MNGKLDEKITKKKQRKQQEVDDWEDDNDDGGFVSDEAMPEDPVSVDALDVVGLAPKLAKSTLDEPEEDEIL